MVNNVVKFKQGTYAALSATGKNANTLYFAERDANGLGGLWLGDKLISSQVVNAVYDETTATLTITKLAANKTTSTVSISLKSLQESATALSARVDTLESLLEVVGENANKTSDKLDQIDSSISSLKAKDSEIDASINSIKTKLDTVEEGGQVNIIEHIKLNGADLTVDSDKRVDLGSIATSTAVEVAATEASKHTSVINASTNDYITVTKNSSTNAAGGAEYIVSDAGLKSAVDAKNVTMTAADGTGDILKVYTLKQGTTEIGQINIPKDLVATSGELVHGSLSGTTFTAADGGDPYIKMTVQNGNPFYIAVKELIEYNSVESTAEITLSDNNHKITATVGKIDGSKIVYKTEDGKETTVNEIVSSLEQAVGEGGSVTTQIENKIATLDASLDASTTAEGKVAVMTGVKEEDGKLTGIAQTEVYTTAKVDTMISSTVEALDSSILASTGRTAVNEGTFVFTKINQVDGKLTSTDSDAVEVYTAAQGKNVENALTWGSFSEEVD